MHQRFVNAIKLLQNEPHGCEERPEEIEEFRVYVVHRVDLEMLSNRYHRNVSTFHSNAWGTRSGGAATDARGVRRHAADINHIHVYNNPCIHRHRGPV